MTVAVATPSARRGLAVRLETDAARWDEFVASRADASGYHAWGWGQVFGQAFGHDTRYLAAARDGCVVGVLPLVLFDSRLFGRFGVSLPFVNYGGVVAEDDETARALLDGAVAEARGAGLRFLELRHTSQRYQELASRRHKVAMTLALEETVDAQWRAVGKKIRNQVRKAEKSGLEAKIGGRELLEPFYDVFARNMRDLGTPVYARAFFESVLASEGDRARVYVVWHGDRAVAASVVLTHRASSEVPWASSIRDYNHLCPNMLLYWTMLREAIGRGRRRFDFGRSTPDGSTFTFKRQWGAQPRELVWEYWTEDGAPLPDFTPSSPRYRLATSVWRRLPLPVASWIGPAIVRNIP